LRSTAYLKWECLVIKCNLIRELTNTNRKREKYTVKKFLLANSLKSVYKQKMDQKPFADKSRNTSNVLPYNGGDGTSQ